MFSIQQRTDGPRTTYKIVRHGYPHMNTLAAIVDGSIATLYSPHTQPRVMACGNPETAHGLAEGHAQELTAR